MSDYHLSLSIGKALWDDLVSAALPVQVADGTFDLSRNVYKGVKQLGVRRKVAALLEDRTDSQTVHRARKRLSSIWHRHRSDVYQFLDEMLHVEGDWKVDIDKEGSEFHYGNQKIGVDAHMKATMTGKAYLLKENLEIPFRIEKRLGAACHLGDIRFDKGEDAVVGSVQSPSVDLGEHVILKVLNEGIKRLLEQQAGRFSSVPIIKKAQLEDMVSPAGGPLKVQMGIDDVRIEVSEEDLSLKVKFGFSQKQLEGE
jgi:hypothetical protein